VTTVEEICDRLWPGRAREITTLTLGITNSNYVVDLGDEKVVVRVPGANTELLGIDRGVELAAARLAASVGVAPEVVAYDEANRSVMTRFIEGRAISTEELATPVMLAQLVESLKLIHRSGTVDAMFNHYEVSRGYRAQADQRGVVAPFDLDRAFSILDAIERARPFRPTVMGHNDLLNANFIFDGRLRIVDWDYAGMADPYFDLANVAVNNAFPPASETELVRLYFGEATEERMALLDLMKVVSELREAMWGVMQMAISKLGVDFRAYATERGEHVLALAASMDLDRLLELARQA